MRPAHLKLPHFLGPYSPFVPCFVLQVDCLVCIVVGVLASCLALCFMKALLAIVTINAPNITT